MNFYDIFSKDVVFDNIKRHKKQDFVLFVENTFFGKPRKTF